MYMTKLLFSLTVLISCASFAAPHMDLEMSSAEYAAQLKLHKFNKKQDDPAITASIKLGERLSKWIAAINATRTADSAIRLTSLQTRRGIPISAPSIYSPKIIKTQSDKILAELPEAIKSVLTSEIELPTTLGIEDTTFITHARLIDKNYQSAVRYKLVDAYREEYTGAAAFDVRGYYFLKENKITAEDLKEVTTLDAEKLKLISDALYKNCLNSATSAEDCKRETEMAVSSNLLPDLYNKYYEVAQKNWNDFFLIPDFGTRTDLLWENSILTVPFNTPEIAKFIPYLQDNIEDEFRFGDFKLKMNFGTFEDGPRLIFESGVTPHVNALGGNEIVMDSNQPIEEYESQWTIRHEFGHVLGLPDCYHEFYDTNLEAYVNYQLDITDLMCSRAGNMNERIYHELKKAYGN
jgi:hypothetical protein